MINKVSFKHFKKLKDDVITLRPSGITLLAGGNNSGKSSILQGLAVWEFCKMVLELERGPETLEVGYAGQGLGMADDTFSPIALPSLKHMWSNLKTQIPGAPDGYVLRIRCEWEKDDVGKFLEFGLAIANDRLFMNTKDTNLVHGDRIPRIAYLPPFAGITDREQFMSGADRRSLIGKGLAGAVVRNLLLDMYRTNEAKRRELKGEMSKIRSLDLAELRATDPWEVLCKALQDTFQMGLSIAPFNDAYHNFIRVETFKGNYFGSRFSKIPGYSPHDLMVEGGGFLQWLSVYTLALDPSTDVILLDEPDAHLHPSLQSILMQRLADVSRDSGKQVLLATHSTEILRESEASQILQIGSGGAKYLQTDDQKVGLFLGLGSEYSSKLDPLRRHKRMLIIEGRMDAQLIRTWAEKLELVWPENLVIWPWSGGQKERKQLFLQLQTEIPELKAISLRDRDDEAANSVGVDLSDKSSDTTIDGLKVVKWRRRHIENYVLCPPSIARAANVDEIVVNDFFRERHALAIPANFADRDAPPALKDARGKDISQKGPHSIKVVFSVSPLDIARAMEPDEVCEDVRILIEHIITVCEA